MTNLQLQYHALQENKRHNLVTEDRDLESNRIKRGELDESRRAHKTNEYITNRHNLVTEHQARADLKEKERHNIATEVAGYMSAAGTFLRGAGSAATAVKSFIPSKTPATGRIGF